MSAKILIVEDESIIALNIKEILMSFGYTVVGIAANSEKAFRLVESKHPDLILMDITLQDREDGIMLAEKISEQISVPIVFLTANDKNQTIDKAITVKPYGYILKPFKDVELKTAIEIALKTFRENQTLSGKLNEVNSEMTSLQSKFSLETKSKMRFVKLKQGYIFDNNEATLLLAGKEIPLNHKEKKLIQLLVRHVGEIVSVAQIEDYVWNGELVGEGSLRSLMFRIRQKLPKDFLTCYSKIGYKITANK